MVYVLDKAQLEIENLGVLTMNTASITKHVIDKHTYTALIELIPDLASLKSGEVLISISKNNIDLNLKVLFKDDTDMLIKLSHYSKHPIANLIPNPDIEIHIDHQEKLVETRTYKTGFTSISLYNNTESLSIKLKKYLNNTLNEYLKIFLREGHQLKR